MKLATYNVWNDARGGEDRRRQLVETIAEADADIIGLQEVAPGLFHERLAGLYPHAEFRAYAGEEEGLALLSRYPIREATWLHELPAYDHSAALGVIVDAEGRRMAVTNLHLPWDSTLQKEKQIVAIDRFIRGQAAEMRVLLGDFNSGLNSSVHRFLLGEQTLLGHEANPYWYELGSTWAVVRDTELLPTLDFLRNPRWGGKNSTEIPMATDRIYVMRHEGMDELRHVTLFGTAVSPESGLAASDHYGVVAEMEFG